MSRTLLTRKNSREGRNLAIIQKKKINRSQDSLNLKGSAKINLMAATFGLSFILIVLGVLYLYQVNSIATKGFEMKEVENSIKQLEEDSKKLKIKEIELRSMYNIEKATEELNLVSSSESVSYVEINDSVAMGKANAKP